jgi:response regulator RpfG family c-di-GMP phosphodiesterase
VEGIASSWQASIRRGTMAEKDKHFAVLYVDCCEPSRKAFHLVCHERFRVFTAATNLEGLDQLEEHKRAVGVIVAARCMPTQSGTWLLQRARDCHPQVFRLLVSDGCSLAAQEASLQDGTAEWIIPIPWEPDELKERLHLELERFAFQRGGAS